MDINDPILDLYRLTNTMLAKVKNIQLLMDAIPCGAQEKADLKLSYDSVRDGNTHQAFLNKCALLSPSVTLLSYGSVMQGHLGFYMSKPWCTKAEAGQWSGRSWNGFSKQITDNDAFLFCDFPSNNIKSICHAQNGRVHFGVQVNCGYGIYIGQNGEINLFQQPSGNSIANIPFNGAGNLHDIQGHVPNKVEVYTVDLGKYMHALNLHVLSKSK